MAWLVCWAMLTFPTAPLAAADIQSIFLVTPAWQGQTNPDGTGLFFEIVAAVYEPVGIKVRYEIVPWKRAQYRVREKQADAMLCVVKQNIGEGILAPKYPMVVEYTAAVFKKAKIPNWEGIGSLAGKNLIWPLGYDYHKNPNLNGIKLKWQEVSSHYSGWKRLETGRNADIWIDSLADIKNYIQSNPVDMRPYRVELLWGEKAYMAFAESQKCKKLIRIHDQRIVKLARSGRLKRIFEKWDIYPYPPNAWEPQAGPSANSR